MAVDSINPNGSRIQTHEQLAKRAEEKRAAEAGRGLDAKRQSGSADRVEISDAARILSGGTAKAGATSGVSGSLSPERIAAITNRITEGYYDRPEIRDSIARRALSDIKDE